MKADGEDDECNEKVEQVLDLEWGHRQMKRKMMKKEVKREESVSDPMVVVVAQLV